MTVSFSFRKCSSALKEINPKSCAHSRHLSHKVKGSNHLVSRALFHSALHQNQTRVTAWLIIIGVAGVASVPAPTVRGLSRQCGPWPGPKPSPDPICEGLRPLPVPSQSASSLETETHKRSSVSNLINGVGVGGVFQEFPEAERRCLKKERTESGGSC